MEAREVEDGEQTGRVQGSARSRASGGWAAA